MFVPAAHKPMQVRGGRDGVNRVRRQAAAPSTAQTKLAHALNGSAQVQTQLRLRGALDGSPRAVAQAQLVQMMMDAARAPVAQKIDTPDLADDDELIQGKSAVQRQDMTDEDELTQMKRVAVQRQEMPADDELLQASPVQRQDAAVEDELLEEMSAQRQEMDEDELTQMRSTIVQRCGAGDRQVSQTKSALQREAMMNEDELTQTMPVQRRANTTGMPDGLKAGIEGLSGLPMDNVQVHYNSPKPASLQAHAYTQGSDIHVAPGQERHLAHEAWHVVQQAQGRVQPTMQMQGTAINDDPGLENEADVMGARALQMARSGAPPLQGQFDAAAGISGDAEPRMYQLASAGAVTQLIYLWDRSSDQDNPVWSDDAAPGGYLLSGRYDDGEHGEDDVYARMGDTDLFYGISYEKGSQKKALKEFIKALKKIGSKHSIDINSSEGFAEAIGIYESEGSMPILDVVSMNALFGGSSGWDRYPSHVSKGEDTLFSRKLQNLNPTLPWAKSSVGRACQVTMIEAIDRDGSVRILLDGVEDIRGILKGKGKRATGITADELRFAVALLGKTIQVGEDETITPEDNVNVFFYLNRRPVQAAWLSKLELAQAMAKKIAEEEEWDEEDEEEGLVDLMEAFAAEFTVSQLKEVLRLP